jgi:hypothetical protein
MPGGDGGGHLDRDDGSCLGLPPGHNGNVGNQQTSSWRRPIWGSGQMFEDPLFALRKKSPPGLPQPALLTVLACGQGPSVVGAAVGHGLAPSTRAVACRLPAAHHKKTV